MSPRASQVRGADAVVRVLPTPTLDDLVTIRDCLAAGAIVILTPSPEVARELIETRDTKSEQLVPRDASLQQSHLLVDLRERKAWWRGTLLDLSKQELALLAALFSDMGRAWSFEELFMQVWGFDYLGDAAPVRSAVKRLRQKLQRVGAYVVIESVRSFGFRLAFGESDEDAIATERPKGSG